MVIIINQLFITVVWVWVWVWVLSTGREEDVHGDSSGVEESVSTEEGADGSNTDVNERGNLKLSSPLLHLVSGWLHNNLAWGLNVVVDNDGWLDKLFISILNLWVVNRTHNL
jgi:hypothetical protein